MPPNGFSIIFLESLSSHHIFDYNLTQLQQKSQHAGDCKDHTDCNIDGVFASVCVQNPTRPLGPCLGDPQSSDIKAADATRPLWNNNQDIDYCVPACRVLLENERGNLEKNRVDEPFYLSFCPNGLETSVIPESQRDSPNACCSQFFNECSSSCSITPLDKDSCENDCWGGNGKLRWLPDGPPTTVDKCLRRYTNFCDGNSKDCCFPATCILGNDGYSQCLAPNDPINQDN